MTGVRPRGVRPRLALWPLAAAGLVVPSEADPAPALSAGEFFKLTNSTLRIVSPCFYADRQYTPVIPSNESGDGCWQQTAAGDCQRRCQQASECLFFTFFDATKRCCLSGKDATFEVAQGAISGPRQCDASGENPGCWEKPGSAFPGDTKTQSLLAWPSHRMPEKLECWPRDWEHNTLHACDKITVLEDSAQGFPARCTGLYEVPVIPQMESCESLCKKSSFCSIFQVVIKDPPYGPKTCMHGYAVTGQDCYVNRENFKPVRAKRFMQGTVRVIRNTTDYQIMGLKNVFQPYYFINITNAVRACRNQCYSSILCQYWQYLSHTGCWLEEPALLPPLEFPPTTQVWHNQSDLAKFIVAGEYIQHHCDAVRSAAPPAALPTTTAGPAAVVFDGSLVVVGLAIANITDAEQTALRILWAKVIADEAAVPTASVKDLGGTPGTVSLSAGADPQAEILAQYSVDVASGSGADLQRVSAALSSQPFLEHVTNRTSAYLVELRSQEAAQGPAEVSDAPLPKIEAESVSSSTEFSSPLPWYCFIIAGGMLVAVAAAGLVGYLWSRVFEGESDEELGASPPPRGTAAAAGLAAGGGRFGDVPKESAGLRVGVRDAARSVAANAGAAVQRAEQAVAGMLPGQGSYSPLQQRGAAPALSRNELMQYAHQGR